MGEELVREPTFIETLNAARQEADRRRGHASGSPAGREFALACTALEDAMMRYNRGRSMQEGVFSTYDFDLPPGERNPDRV